MNVGTQNFLLLGASKSGLSAGRFILSRGAKCYVYEERKNIRTDNALKELSSLGAIIVNENGADEAIADSDVVVISPGVPINHDVAVKAKNEKKRIIGELEFGFSSLLPTTVAVTGTNGKTTTVSMIEHILKNCGKDVFAVGNVGVPVTEKLGEIRNDSVVVAEVSSFQLESVYSFCPHIACVLNVSPDHLERHYTMDNYVFLKKRIFSRQRESEYTVLNFDDERVRGFAPETRGKVVFVSLKENRDGAYKSGNGLYFKGDLIITTDELPVKGEHNEYNALFAIACSKLLGISDEKIAEGLKTFKGVKHRIEFVGNVRGVNYYNDSKSTNTASAVTALSAMNGPTVLILGGSEKGENYTALFEKIKISGVRHVVLTGASRFNMLSCASKTGFSDLSLTPDFCDAVKMASIIARDGDNVLLSPACASFDCFSGFEERGERFSQIVGELN